MGAHSKRKGKRGELEVVALYRAAGFSARRGQQNRGTPDSPDVIIDDLPLLHVEVKRAERFNIYDALEQAQRDASDDQIPVVHHRRGQKLPGDKAFPWVVVMGFEDFAKLIREAADVLKRRCRGGYLNCSHDTNHDGDCHRCARQPPGAVRRDDEDFDAEFA